ncbi:YveK family protein [Brevibacillus sp. TJ4]|uniref:YveK family protein n=1 Tax=Brevibacillus sp. TJ4 TaxID=3234853 RepID=UPI0037CE59A0
MSLEFVLLILQALRKRWILMTTIPLVCVAVSGFISYVVMVPTYEASTTLLVRPQALEKQDLYTSILSNQQLIKTYSGLIQTRKIAQDVISKLDLPLTPEALLEKLDVNTSNISFIITLTYSDPDPEMAVRIVNEFSRSFSENVNLFMNMDNVVIIDEAKFYEEVQPASPKPMLNMAAAFFVGLFFMAFTLIVVEAREAMQKKQARKHGQLAKQDTNTERVHSERSNDCEEAD